MKPDWTRVSVGHVRRACRLYDNGNARPTRPAKSTFLLLDGKRYPAKFIRGVAYRLACGDELDPNRDYSGGTETATFFQRLGLTTEHEPTATPSAPASSARKTPSPAVRSAPPAAPTPTAGRRERRPRTAAAPPTRPAPPAAAPRTTTGKRRGREPQKAALEKLLRSQFGSVEMETKFPWLTVPRPSQMDGTLEAIYRALQRMRGFSTFSTDGYALSCDFFIPSERLIIEYDERQHFTRQRAAVLELYPPHLALGFERQEWLTACRTIQASDPSPAYRDEQRAFYDGLRDILAAQHGVRLVRLRAGAIDWTGPGAQAHLDALTERRAPRAAEPGSGSAATAEQIRKVALVSHNYTIADSHGLTDYSEHFARINQLCDEQRCDTILYALYTWDPDSTVTRTHDAIFGGLRHVQRVILEVGQPLPKSIDHIEVWTRDQQAPLVTKQRFSFSGQGDDLKRAFMRDLPRRRVADGLLVSCGETNIASTVRGSEQFSDPHRFSERLWDMNVGPILNPIHDYMRRHEMKKKRAHYSLGDRTVISVWNQGRHGEAALPWTVFRDGVEQTSAVEELPRPFRHRHDIRIGVVDVATL